MSDSDAAESAWARVDTTVPHSARVWDFLLGGTDHFPVDRETGETLLRLFPDFAMVARLQREFLVRARNIQPIGLVLLISPHAFDYGYQTSHRQSLAGANDRTPSPLGRWRAGNIAAME